MTAIDIGTIAPIARDEAARLAQAETARMVDALRALPADDWSKPTDCTLWDVRDMAGHVLGMTETFTGLRRFVPDMITGRRRAGDGAFVDGLTALQVDRSASLSTSQLLDRLVAAGPAAARWRSSRRLMRAIRMKQELHDGSIERWRFSYLIDVILTRDTWMHRVDLARATGRPMHLTAEHDGRIVADAVAEWGRRHGQPFVLHLTGPAGGDYSQGRGGEEITIDTLEYCRVLSGRGEPTGLLANQVPF